MLRIFAVLALSSTALIACKNSSSSAPGGCESGYVMTQGNICVMQNVVDYNQCVESAAARESINVGLTKEILGRLQGDGYVMFDQLFDLTLGTQGLVVSFLAMLELARESLIEITQNEAMAPIYVKLPDAAAV